MKADRMTMANGLELRVPFLDHKLVEFAATLPAASKHEKAILRSSMRGVIPDAIIDRPKKGFSIPIASWLRSSLREFARDHLLAQNSACGSYLDRSEVARIVQEHETGRADRSQEMWTLLVLEFWHRHFIGNAHVERPMAVAL
jgi:asparagine synthase (glutamine-hydrolysing)